MNPQVDDEGFGRASAGGATVMEREEVASPPPPSASPPRAPRRRRLLQPRHPWVWLTVVVGALLVIYATVSVIGATVMTRGTHEAITVAASSIGPVHEDVSFPSRVDSLTLRGWLFHAEPSNGRSVVMVNGFRNNRVNTAYGAAPVAQDLLQHGYDVLLFDLRSCGESDGDRFTMGNLEPRDLLGAYDFMKSRGYVANRMAILGVSLGASTELLAASQMKDVGAMVADSAFAELRPVINDRLGKESPLPRFFDWGIITAGSMFFNINPDLRPVDSVRALGDRAFLFFQASGDDWFPPSHARELFAASANPQSRLVIVETEGHAKTYRAGPAAYMQTVYAFVDQQIAQRGG